MLKKFEQHVFNKKIIFGVFLIFIALVVLEIWAVNRLATFGEKINQIERLKAQIHLENQILENQIAQGSSIKNLKDLTMDAGFQKISTLYYIQPSGLALNH